MAEAAAAGAGLAQFEEWADFAEEVLNRALAQPRDLKLRDEVAGVAEARFGKREAVLRIWEEAAPIAAVPKAEPEGIKRRRLDEPRVTVSRRAEPARVEPKPEAEVELAAAKARIAELEGSKPVRFAPGPIEGEVILSASSPYDTAKEFTKRYCAQGGEVIVFFSQDQFWRWNGRHYAVEPIDNIKAQVYDFLDGALKWVGGNKTRFQPNPKTVNDVMDGLKYGLKLPPEVRPPMWLDSHEPATDWVVFRNGAVNVLTGEMREPTPKLWVQSALKFDWLSAAKADVWERFKEDLFPGDEESKACLEEWMGYCMTEETKFQKAIMFIGPKRSGKTTISNLIQALVGDDGYATLNFDTWTATENSRECLIGKRVAVFQDVRLKPGKHYGQSYDAGGISHVSASYLLQYIGEAPANIGRKNIQAWQGQLRAKFMVISNEVPNLNDSQGTLPSRFVKLRFGVSFFGREDVELWGKLRAELPGIAARCVGAYQRLCARGRFVQPRSAAVLEQAVTAASDPFAAMFAECFVAEPEAMVLKAVAYNKFIAWCGENGRQDLKLGISSAKFTARLRDYVPNLGSYQPHGGARYYLNLRIRKKEDGGICE